MRDKIVFNFFFAGGRGTYQIENIMFPCISWERSSLFRFPSREKIPCFREKIPPFQIVQERSCPGAVLFEKTIFLDHFQQISSINKHVCTFYNSELSSPYPYYTYPNENILTLYVHFLFLLGIFVHMKEVRTKQICNKIIF